MKVKAAERAVVIYDGRCPVCREAIAWIKKHERPGAFEMLPCQSPARRSRYPGIPEALCMDALQLVLPDGRVLTGETAFPAILKRLEGFSRIPAPLLTLPGFPTFSKWFYRRFAENRYAVAAALRPFLSKNRRKKGTRKKGTGDTSLL